MADEAAKAEFPDFKQLAGTFVWPGSEVLSQAAYFGSLFQQKVPMLKTCQISETNRTTKQLKKLNPTIKFCRPFRAPQQMELFSFCDTFFNITNRQVYGQTGIATGIWYHQSNIDILTYHPNHSTSPKQKKVLYSAYGTDIIASATTENRSYAIKQEPKELLPNLYCFHQVEIDSNVVFDPVSE